MIQSHHLPTCDDVFEILTRAPFPTGEHEVDFPIQRHLTVCHSCRELAEALRPVTAVLAEGQSEEVEEETPLPAFLAECGVPSGCGTDAQLERKRTGNWRKISGALLALSACLLVMVGGSSSWLASQYQTSPGQPRATHQRSGLSSSPLPGLADAILPGAGCSLMAVQNLEAQSPQKRAGIAADEQNDRLAHELSEKQCCSQCHHAGNQASHGGAQKGIHLHGPKLVALVNQCTVCHE